MEKRENEGVRKQIEKDYQIENNVIRSPGKFEGLSRWTPYFYALWGEGLQNEDEWRDDESIAAVFYPGRNEQAWYPELKGVAEIQMWEDDQGFVHTVTLDKRQDR